MPLCNNYDITLKLAMATPSLAHMAKQLKMQITRPQSLWQ